ncbi:MAG: Gfo/Idh/MocA family oxidoreductase [Tissierellia bacterium]|nr:Gfo/Idh/MocA family oxidoreductase [Tissierellia bacterium]
MRLGIIGTGKIAQEVLEVIKDFQISKVILSTHRSRQKSEKLSQIYNIEKIYYEYDELLKDKLDTVYVALPNNLHYEFCKKAIESNKNVIVEKPICTNLNQLEHLKSLANKNGVFLIEAMNIHHLKALKSIKKDLNKIGNIKTVQLNYTQYSSRFDDFKKGIIKPVFDPKYNGGALNDLGIYNIHALIYLFGMPKEYKYYPNINKNIDTSGILICDYGEFKATLIAAKDSIGESGILISGEDGYIVSNKAINEIDNYDLIYRKRQKENFKFQFSHRLKDEFIDIFKIIKDKDKAKEEDLFDISKKAVEMLENLQIYNLK